MSRPKARPSTLEATLLGDVFFRFTGTEIRPSSKKGTALLAYLSLTPEGASREDLAEVFWGHGKLANLRQELYSLRHLTGADDWLHEDASGVRVTASTDVAGLSAGRAGDSLTQPLGELLPGFGRLDAPAFIDWLDLERRRVAELLRKSRLEAAEAMELAGRYDEALALLDAALTVDPLDEQLVRAAMRAAHAAGSRAEALARFETLRRHAQDEFELEPEPETLELAGLIERGERLNRPLDLTEVVGELKDLVQIVAIADGALDVERVAKVAERRPLDVAADLARLERSGWLDQNLLMQQATRESVLTSSASVVKRLLSLRIAQALETTGAPPEVIARHLLSADRAREAAPLLVAAGEAASGRGDIAGAMAHLLRALWAATDAPETRLAAALLLEGCAGQSGDDELQDAALAEAEELAWRLQHDPELAEVRMRRSRAQLRRGDVGKGLESALEALEIAARLGDEQLIARARNAVGGAQYYAGDLDGAEASFAANADVANPIERYRARNNLGSIAGIRGRPHEALEHLEVALTLGRAAGEHAGVVGTLNNVAATAERVGDHRRAIKYFKESLALARSSGSTAVQGQVLVNLAVIYSRVGELGPAWNTAVEVEEMALELGDPRLTMLAYEQQAEVANLCGDAQAALHLVESAHAQAQLIGDERKQAGLLGAKLVLEACVDPALLSRAVEYLGQLDDSRWDDVKHWLFLELALASDDPGAAASWLTQAEEVAGDSEHVAMVIALGRLRTGLLPEAGAVHVEAAGRAHDRLTGSGDEAGFTRFVQGPHARLLTERWRSVVSATGAGGSPAPGADDVLEVVRADLLEQAAGLPKSLKTSLLTRPESWLAGLRS